MIPAIVTIVSDHMETRLKKDIYFGAVYKTPSNSSSTKSRYNVDTYMILQKEVSFFSSLGGEIILGGDFNSRLGNKHKDYIIKDTSEFLPIDNSIIEADIITFRNSQDKKTNSNRKHLADLCMINNLKILNGRKIGDLTGKYTCHQYNGSSVVDYIIAGPNIVNKINYFHVLPLTTYSDQIVSNLDIKPNIQQLLVKKAMQKPKDNLNGTAILNKKSILI